MKTENKKLNLILFISILLVGGILRLYGLREYPGGVHVDEAFAGYEAYSMSEYGVDSWGYKNPVYFVSWGSGMNVLESYIMIPFVKILGLNELSIRLPQALFSILFLVMIYLILKKIKDEKLALIGMFLTAVSPWHYMLSRWGLESNLCLIMILLGTYFFILGTECFVNENVSKKNVWYIVPSAFFFGLDLYAYAATWIHMAVIITVWSAYILIYKIKNKISAKGTFIPVIIAIGLLAFMAIPLAMFILINIDVIPEIRGFISIPKLVVFRNDEVFNLSQLYNRVHDLAYILICQNDTQMWNAYLPYGMFYIYSLPIIFIGVWRVFVRLIKDFKEKQFSYAFMLVTYTSIATVLVLLQAVSIIRANYLELTLLFYWAIGVNWLFGLLKGYVGKGLVAIYVISFVLFLISYFNGFQDRISLRQVAGSGEAIEDALSMVETGEYRKICLEEEIRHARVLFYTKYDPNEYMSSVKWANYPDKYLVSESFGPFVWEDVYKNGAKDDYIYILRLYRDQYPDFFPDNGFEVKQYGSVWMAYKSR